MYDLFMICTLLICWENKCNSRAPHTIYYFSHYWIDIDPTASQPPILCYCDLYHCKWRQISFKWLFDQTDFTRIPSFS